MNGYSNSPLTLSLMIIVAAYFFVFHPWLRRRTKRVSLERQVRFAFIIAFIFGGGYVINGFRVVLLRNNLSHIYSIVFGGTLIIAGIFVMKKSMKAYKVAIGVLIFYLLWSVTEVYFTYTLRIMGIKNRVFDVVTWLLSTAVIFSPLDQPPYFVPLPELVHKRR